VLVRLNQLEEELEVVVEDVGVDQFLALPVHDADVRNHVSRFTLSPFRNPQSINP